MAALKLTQIGNSVGVILPKEVLARLKLEKGGTVFVTETLKHWNDNFQVGLQENELSAPAMLAEVQPTPVSAARKGK